MKLTNALVAAFLMLGAAACSTVPATEQTQTAEASAADSLSKDASMSGDGAAVSSVDTPAQDPLAAPAHTADTTSSMSAPSSLGASSSGRGH